MRPGRRPPGVQRRCRGTSPSRAIPQSCSLAARPRPSQGPLPEAVPEQVGAPAAPPPAALPAASPRLHGQRWTQGRNCPSGRRGNVRGARARWRAGQVELLRPPPAAPRPGSWARRGGNPLTHLMPAQDSTAHVSLRPARAGGACCGWPRSDPASRRSGPRAPPGAVGSATHQPQALSGPAHRSPAGLPPCGGHARAPGPLAPPRPARP
mmetsp:Transcript_89851/g.290814  ORF Transcript_89851/g.290814 Transcript_89851/m.290814 type:complete len:209 (-) Transcript_89851:104-730(-)